MARGIYPVSAIRLGANGKPRRRGYYHAYTHEFFRPRWWPLQVSKILQSKLGETIYDRDVTKAFPVPSNCNLTQDLLLGDLHINVMKADI